MAPLRILHLEDSPLDAELTLAALSEAGVDPHLERVDTREAFNVALGQSWDLILSDYMLPTFNGLTALQIARDKCPDVPFIFVSGALGEELAIEMLKGGATDYVLKQRLGRLGPAVHRAVREAQERAVRLQIEKGLRQSEDRYRFLADAVPQIVWTVSPDGVTDYCNKVWLDYTGLTQTNGVQSWADVIHPDDLPAAMRRWQNSLQTGSPFEIEYRFRRHDGVYRWHLGRCIPRRDGAGVLLQWVGSATDIDDRRQSEAAVRRSESLYRTLAEAVPGVVFTNRPDGSVDYINPAWTHYTGQSIDEAQRGGDGWTSVVHPQDLRRVQDWWGDCVRTGKPRLIEYRIRNPEGRFRWILVRVMPMRDEAGNILQWVGTATDIDAQKRAEADYRRLLNQLDAIIGNMNEGLAVGDANGNLLSMNAAGFRMHGYVAGEEYRRNIKDLTGVFELSTLTGTEVPLDQWPMSRALAGETFSDLELRLHYKGTGHRWVANYAGCPIRNAAGQIEMVIVTFRDVTTQKRTESELAMAKEQAEAANRMKDEFLATLSHELRTPLNAILGWTQLLLLDSADPDDLRHGLQTIERNAQVQTQLVADLLDVSRIISGKVHLTPKPTNLRGVLDAANDALRPAADARGVRLETVVERPDPIVTGDADRLQQVMWNLLSNAIKFTPRGGLVQSRLRRVESQIHLVVTDSGQGISPDFLPHVFERFRQADGSISRSHGGLGLGLAIVRHLVELHGGTVRAESEGDGKGSTFTVSLPVAAPFDQVGMTAAEVDAADLLAEASTPAPAPPPKPADALKGLRILVVDDEPDARAVVAAVLNRQQADVTAVGSAAEALEMVQRLRPDVMVSDIGMPLEDGYGLMRSVRKLSSAQGGSVPAVALTAYARVEDRVRTQEAGFQAHLHKPVEAHELVHTVAALAGRPLNS